jgi:hypothetical protein
MGSQSDSSSGWMLLSWPIHQQPRCCGVASLSSAGFTVKFKKNPRLLFILFVTCLHINVNKRRKK